MMTIYFYGNNRNIVNENVVKCYQMLKQHGFQPAMGKIKLVEGEDLAKERIFKVTVVPKTNTKPLSINNFIVKTEEVTDEEERRKAKAPADGQHRQIAMALMEALDGFIYNEEEMAEIVKKPEAMSLEQFTAAMNSGRPWNYKDFGNSKLTTGNKEIDYIESQITEQELKSDVVYSFYTLGQPNLKPSVTNDLKLGIDKLPKGFKLDTNTQSMGDMIVKAFKDSSISKEAFNNGRLAKGFKKFYNDLKSKDNEPKLDDILTIIAAMNKDIWHTNYPKPNGSPEAKHFAENFSKYYEQIVTAEQKAC